MPITVFLQENDGTILESLANQGMWPGELLPATGDAGFPFLGLIDPYGDTYFSPLQMRAVLPEVRKLRAQTDGGEILEELERLAELCAASADVQLLFAAD